MSRARFLVLALFPLAACNCEDELGQLNGALEVDPPQLDFGTVARDLVKELPLTLHNRGLFPLNIQSYSATAPFIAPVVTSSIGTGTSIMVRVGFQPRELGPISGTLTITSDDPKAPVVEVPLIGTGIEAAVKVEPGLVDFGEVEWIANTPEQTREVTVSNPGTDAFELTAIELTDDGMDTFSIDRMSAVTTYAPGHSAKFLVKYNPNARRQDSGAIRISTTTRQAPEITVPLRAHAVGPELQICAAATGDPELCTAAGENPRVQWEPIPLNTSATGTIRVMNTGERPMVINSVFLTSEETEMTFTPGVPSTGAMNLAAGSELVWNVTYAPADYVHDAVFLGYATNDARGARSVQLVGDASSARIRVNPGSLTFTHMGAITHGETPVRIHNCGQEPLTINNNIVMNQTSGPEPALSIINVPSMGLTIQPQPGCTMDPPGAEFRVVFDTNVNGTYEGEVAIESNDPTQETFTVQVTATKR